MFKGVREDLESPAVPRSRGTPVRSEGRQAKTAVPPENILQLLPDAVTPSKEELGAYWAKVWKRALPHLGRRPLKLVRHVRGTTFYHMGKLPPVPEAVHRLTIEKREGGEGTRLWVDDLAGLSALSRSARSSCTLGTQGSTISSIPTGSCSISILARVWAGAS